MSSYSEDLLKKSISTVGAYFSKFSEDSLRQKKTESIVAYLQMQFRSWCGIHMISLDKKGKKEKQFREKEEEKREKNGPE